MNILKNIKRWIYMIFNKSKTIKEITKVDINEEHYKLIEAWKHIYAGYYDEWHEVKYHTIDGYRKRTMHSLRMSKVMCEELSKLIFNEKVDINISDKTFHANINDTLEKNRFNKVFQNKIEYMLALGGLVLKAIPKERKDGSNYLKISYVTPDCFIPTAWENGEVTEGIFLNITRKGDKIYCLFEFHEWKGSQYSIRNELYEGDSKTQDSKRIPLDQLYEDLEEQVFIDGLSQSLFVYMKPNISNNFDLQSPLGVSIFANSLDTLKAIDIAFDSFIREFKLGRRRIIVPSDSIRTVVDPKTGEMNRYFDASDEVYQAMNYSDPEKQKVIDNTVGLRVQEHIAAINSLLNILSMQTGFSSGTFVFDGVSVKTATEIVSEKSKTYQTKQSLENVIDEGLRKFIFTLGELAALYNIFPAATDDCEIEFNWDDSIIQDRDADSEFYIKLKNNGLVSAKYCLMHILKLTEEQAEEMLEEIAEENASNAPDIDEIPFDLEKAKYGDDE